MRTAKPRLSLSEICAIAAPAAMTVAVLPFSDAAGIFLGASMAAFAMGFFPLALIPLLLVAAGFNQVARVEGLQFGWWIVLGSAMGVFIRGMREGVKLKFDPEYIKVVIAFLLLASVSSFLKQE